MKTKLFSILGLFALILSVSTARAKVPPLLEVPDYLSAVVKQDLINQREALEKRIFALRVWSTNFNAKCGNRDLPTDDPLGQGMSAEKAKLDQAGQDYTRDALAFDDLILSHTEVGALGNVAVSFI